MARGSRSRGGGGGGGGGGGSKGSSVGAGGRESAEKSSWEWVEHVKDVNRDVGERHIQLAYRLHFPVHVEPQCKKNCKQNPKCYCGLGRAKWLAERPSSSSSSRGEKAANDEDDEDDDEEDSDDDDETCFERRKTGLPIGLKNLGNTCYVNSFLQIWFHNTQFRNALYSWDPEQDLEERSNKTLYKTDQEYRPEGIIANLQALFAIMEFSNRKAVDPNEFITKLGLDPQVQQDAQEFSKLFISLLESKLNSQINQVVRGMIQTQFCGNYAYVTTCCACKRESKRPSSFYELDLTLQGNKTLNDCMDGFLKVERLEGDNQYYCEDCRCKQDATRCVRLLNLPTVLNLQLNRFIFDMQTGRKKKLNSYVQFPEELDMSQYVNQPAGTHMYSLSGVLMHIGAEANHGHYVAHIHESSSGRWFKFSDAQVERLDRTSSSLGSEKDPLRDNDQIKSNGTSNGKHCGRGKAGGNASSSASSASGKLSKKCLRSNSAYMLVYALKARPTNEQSGSLAKKSKLCQIVQRLAEKKIEETSPPEKKKQRDQRTKLRGGVANSCGGAVNGGVAGSGGVDPLTEQLLLESNGGIAFPVNFPMRLRAFVERDRGLFQEQVSENKLEKRENLNKKETLHKKMLDFSLKVVFKGSSSSSGKLQQLQQQKSGGILSDEDELDDDFEFVPKNILQKFLEDPDNAGGMTLAERINYMCAHGKLDIDLLADLKVVDSGAADEMYLALRDNCAAAAAAAVAAAAAAGAKGGSEKATVDQQQQLLKQQQQPRDKWDKSALCQICVRNRCRLMILHNKIAADAKDITELTKVVKKEGCPATDTSEEYWVGKSSLKRWRTLAKDSFTKEIETETRKYLKLAEARSPEKSPPLSPFLPTLVNGSSSAGAAAVGQERGEEGGEGGEVKAEENGAAADPSASHAFNEDIACAHGKLCPKTEKKRSLVTPAVWNILRAYFTTCPEFPSGSEPCEDCMDKAKNVALFHEGKKEVAAAQKSALSDILNERNRPTWSKSSLNKVYLIPRSFVYSWRSFARNPSSHDEVLTIGNETLLCKCGGLMYPPKLDLESDYESVVYMVSEEEWRELSRLFEVDREIEVLRHREGPDLLTSEPKVCESCVRERVRQEEEQKLTYSNEPVYVRRLMGAEMPPPNLLEDPDFMTSSESNQQEAAGVESTSGSSSSSASVTSSATANQNGEPMTKRQKVNSNKVHNNTIPSELIRRSNRRQKVRGEKEFFVNSDMLLRDFKVKIMEVFKIPPFDQNLSVEGRYLTDTKQTLGQLRVLPKSLIYLRADEPAANGGGVGGSGGSGIGSGITPSIEPEDCWNSQNPEEGFKGTGLLSGF